MMLPILISVSVAPVSYFFWAIAAVLVAANKIMVADSTCNRSRKAGMIDLLDLVSASSFLGQIARYWASQIIPEPVQTLTDFWLRTAITCRRCASHRRRADPNFFVMMSRSSARLHVRRPFANAVEYTSVGSAIMPAASLSREVVVAGA